MKLTQSNTPQNINSTLISIMKKIEEQKSESNVKQAVLYTKTQQKPVDIFR